MRNLALSVDDDNKIKPLRQHNRELLKKSRYFMNRKLRLLVRNYVATWKLTS